MIEKENYFYKYNLNWEAFDVIINGKSSIDATSYLSYFSTKDDVIGFLEGYGFKASDPIQKGELFGHYQEALQFIKRYFLKEGRKDGLDYQIPNSFYTITDLLDLFLMATDRLEKKYTIEDSIWASIVLKVMHTILHTDKDLRYSYFPIIKQQIFDNFYKYIDRDESGKLFLKSDKEKIPLVNFDTKSQKTRDSIIIKLLHKKESVAEQLFDRIGVRFITHSKFDCLRVIKFLYKNNIIIANNIKSSRSRNSLMDLKKFKTFYVKSMKNALDGTWDESRYVEELTKYCHDECPIEQVRTNEHSLDEYKAIHFTCRQLIKYRNPFSKEFFDLRNMAKKSDSELSKKILAMDYSMIAQDIRFFYPYEVQVVDSDSHENNTKGEASHDEYKNQQIKTASDRLFAELTMFYSHTR